MTYRQNEPHVVALARGMRHGISKEIVQEICLLPGLGVEGDAHCGEKVKHRSRARSHPDSPNLRQVHLIQAGLYEELGAKGFAFPPGSLGENITLAGMDLLGLPTGSLIRFPSGAEVELTGLRNPCKQLEDLAPGLMAALLEKTGDGTIIRKGGVMAIVLAGGIIRAGDKAHIEPGKGMALAPV